jgi:hypothetical protein
LRRSCRRFRDSAEEAEKALGELVAVGMGTWETVVGTAGGRPPRTFVLSQDESSLSVTETPSIQGENRGFGDSDNSDMEKLNSLLAEAAHDGTDDEGSVEWTS